MKKKIFLSVFLSVICFVSVFTFFGCGESPAETLSKKFDKLDATYKKYSDTFVLDGGTDQDAGNKIEFNYKVDFGEQINDLVQKDQDNFGELGDLYNAAFIISNEYIDQNYEYVCEFLTNEKNVSKEVNSKIDALNKSIDSYTKQISKFASDKVVFQKDVEKYKDKDLGAIVEESIQGDLLGFKKSFGKLVELNVEFSTDLAEAVEATKIYELLKKLDDPLKSDVVIVKDFIRAKMLHLFTDFKLTEFANKMTWTVDLNTDQNNAGKMRIDNLVKALDNQYETFKKEFVLTELHFAENERAPMGVISDLLEKSKEFLLEAESYSKALKEINFYDFSVNNDSNMEKYLKSNKFAEVYMQKLEQFVSLTLPKFMEYVSGVMQQLETANV